MRTLCAGLITEQLDELLDYQRRYSSCFRTAYERIYEGGSITKELVDYFSQKFDLPNWVARMAAGDAEGQVQAHKSQEKTRQRTKKVIWGGRKNFDLLNKGLISAEEFSALRMRPMMFVGAIGNKSMPSNRMFNFDLKKQIIEFKPERGTKIAIQVVPRSRKHAAELRALQEYVGKLPISIRLDPTKGEVQIVFQEQMKEFDYETGEIVELTKFVPGRVLGIDMNPNSIGVSVPDIDQHFVYQFQTKGMTNSKRNHETIQIAHAVINYMKSHHIGVIALEKLDMKQGNQGKGSGFNYLVNTLWKKTLFANKIKHLAAINGIQVIEVPPQYSSFVGAVQDELPDPICAAKEIALRGLRKIQGLKGDAFLFPGKTIRCATNRWKEEVADGVGYRELYKRLKAEASPGKQTYSRLTCDEFVQRGGQVTTNRFMSKNSLTSVKQIAIICSDF